MTHHRCHGECRLADRNCAAARISTESTSPAKPAARRPSRNQLKAKMSAKEKASSRTTGWFVGVTPRRNPEIVVACLFEGGEHGALAARVAAPRSSPRMSRSSAAFKPRSRRPTPGGNKQAEVAAVWHEGDAKNPDKLQSGHFTVPTGASVKPVAGAPGVERRDAEADSPGRSASHGIAHRDGAA